MEIRVRGSLSFVVSSVFIAQQAIVSPKSPGRTGAAQQQYRCAASEKKMSLEMGTNMKTQHNPPLKFTQAGNLESIWKNATITYVLICKLRFMILRHTNFW